MGIAKFFKSWFVPPKQLAAKNEQLSQMNGVQYQTTHFNKIEDLKLQIEDWRNGKREKPIEQYESLLNGKRVKSVISFLPRRK